MTHRLLRTALLLALVSGLPTLSLHAQNKKKAPQDPKDSEKLTAGSYTGILKTTPGSDRTFVLSIETTRAVPKGRGAGRVGGGRRGLARMARPQQYRLLTTSTDYEMQNKESVKVRVLKLPDQFDEKGKLRKPTSKELAELKGKDKNLPGYESAVEKLESGQRVTVTLVEVAKKKAAAGANKDKEKDKDKDDEKKMQVKLIVINAEADEVKKGKNRKGG
jgi:hypothetical protein